MSEEYDPEFFESAESVIDALNTVLELVEIDLNMLMPEDWSPNTDNRANEELIKDFSLRLNTKHILEDMIESRRYCIKKAEERLLEICKNCKKVNKKCGRESFTC